MKVSTILDHIDSGGMALPEFQRGFVWNRAQVRNLLFSLYRRYPVGSLMVWVTKTENAEARGDGQLQAGTVKLLLDGQQRITSLYGIIRGKPPKFFDGNASAFSGIYFHLDEEVFEFYGPLKMKDNPLWINVTELMQIGVGKFIGRLFSNPDLQEKIEQYINRLTAIDTIKEIDFHVDEITGEDKSIDIIVDIFNRVNSGGTKLSKGDLALAKICSEWYDSRDEMKKRLKKWEKAGFNFKLEWFLRCINTIVTGEALFSALKDVNTSTFQEGLIKAEKAIDYLLNLISSHLGLDHDRVLGSRYSFPLLVRYLSERNFKIPSQKEIDKLLYWYIHTILWGRYAGSTESVLNKDLKAIEEVEGSLDRLNGLLRQERGDLKIKPEDFITWSSSSRFYPLLYMMSRTMHTRDLGNGIELKSSLLGKLSGLQVHHIFPKDLLYEHEFEKHDVHQVANFTFLTQDSNLNISNTSPEIYFESIQKNFPGVLESNWIPMDKQLWMTENYPKFLDARRELLAKAANEFLDSLFSGTRQHIVKAIPEVIPVLKTVPRSIETDEEMKILNDFNEWIVQRGFTRGEIGFELIDPKTGELVATLDLAWPNGLQEGLSHPIALLIDERQETIVAVNRMGYRYYTNMPDFKEYVESLLTVA